MANCSWRVGIGALGIGLAARVATLPPDGPASIALGVGVEVVVAQRWRRGGGGGVEVVEAHWQREHGRTLPLPLTLPRILTLAESVERARQNSPKWSAPDLSSLYRETTRRSSGYIATSPIAHTSSASTRPSPSPSRLAKRWERLRSSGALKCVLEASSFITAAVGGGARGTAAASVAELPRRRPICTRLRTAASSWRSSAYPALPPRVS